MKTPSFLKEAPRPGAGVRVKDEAAGGPGEAGILYPDEHRAKVDNRKRRVPPRIASAITHVGSGLADWGGVGVGGRKRWGAELH